MKRLTLTSAVLLGLCMTSTSYAETGESVYNKSCKLCHASGAMGAPKVGAQADWQARIKKGMPELEKNSIEGFRGYRGLMPPKGGNANLSDDEVRAAVAFMVEASQ